MWRRLAFFCLVVLALSLRTWSQASPPVPATVPAAFVDSTGARIHYEDGGSGRGIPVLFVHGLAGDLEMWRGQLGPLRKARRAVALDLRGHGLSGLAKDGDYSIPAMASDVLAVADALNLDRFVLVAHSMGGAVALAVSQKAPARVAGMLFADPAGDVSRLSKARLDVMLDKMQAPTYRVFMKGWFGVNLENGRQATRDLVFADLERTRPDVARASYKGLASYRPAPALAMFRGPMLTVILPGSDRPSSYQNLVPGVDCIKIADLSHWLMMDDPEGFNAIMQDFLRRVEDRAYRGRSR